MKYILVILALASCARGPTELCQFYTDSTRHSVYNSECPMNEVMVGLSPTGGGEIICAHPIVECPTLEGE